MTTLSNLVLLCGYIIQTCETDVVGRQCSESVMFLLVGSGISAFCFCMW